MSIDGLVERLAAVLSTMRQDSLTSVALFLDSAEGERGGILVLQAPCTMAKRGIPEAGYRTERFNELV